MKNISLNIVFGSRKLEKLGLMCRILTVNRERYYFLTYWEQKGGKAGCRVERGTDMEEEDKKKDVCGYWKIDWKKEGRIEEEAK